jgi:hypothetical protein
MVATIFWTGYLGILGTVTIGYLIKRKFKTTLAKIDFVFSHHLDWIIWLRHEHTDFNSDRMENSLFRRLSVGFNIWHVLK